MAQQLDWYGSTGKDNRHERDLRALAEGVAFWQQQVQHLRAQFVETRKREDAACSVRAVTTRGRSMGLPSLGGRRLPDRALIASDNARAPEVVVVG